MKANELLASFPKACNARAVPADPLVCTHIGSAWPSGRNRRRSLRSGSSIHGIVAFFGIIRMSQTISASTAGRTILIFSLSTLGDLGFDIAMR